MRLGGPLFGECNGAEGWVNAVRATGYRAAFCPLDSNASNDEIKAYEQAAEKADIIIVSNSHFG